MKNLLAFDLETAAAPPAAREDNWAIGVTCGVTHREEDSPIRWHGMIQPDERYSLRMPAGIVRSLTQYLISAGERNQIVTINGAHFDFQVLAAECQCPDTVKALRELALDHYDPCLQMLCQRGFPVGLEALCKGFGLRGKSEGMDGATAASQWFGSRSDQEQVLAYCEQDARATLDVALNIQSAEGMRWVSKRSGKRLWEPGGLLTVRECLELPLPNVDWMDDPPSREDFVGWLL